MKIVLFFFLVPLIVRAGNITIETTLTPTGVTASSEHMPAMGPARLTDGSGLNADAQHDDNPNAATMWHTAVGATPSPPAPGLPAAPAWVRFDFAKPEKPDSVLIWNHNQQGMEDRGFRKIRLLGSADGKTWSDLTKPAELSRGGTRAHTIALESPTPVTSVIIAAESNWGGNVSGLSEVRFVKRETVAEDAAPFPSELKTTVRPIYRHRPDGKPGREVTVDFIGAKLHGAGELEVSCEGKTESLAIPATPAGIASRTLLLPDGVGVSAASAKLTLRSGKRSISADCSIPAERQWTVFVYPHSHVDIGYTQPQDIIEKITVKNLLVGMEIARDSRKHPDDARYVWNPEVTWAAENFLKAATPEQKQTFIQAVQRGEVGIDASFAHLNTSVCSDEELIRYFRGGMKLRKLTGAPVDTMVQVDVPGATWGLPQAAAQCGVKGILDFPNGFDRIGAIHSHFQQPFWWVAPDGKHRILYLQGPRYDLGWVWKGSNVRPEPYPKFENPAPGWIQDYPPVTDRVRTAKPSDHFIPLEFILNTTATLVRQGQPYDYITMTWSMSDNSIPDADLPDAVSDWNRKYAYPKLVIASASEIINAYITKFGKVIPEKRGDLTEYWTDGLGSDALRVGYNRLAKERLIQTETLHSMRYGRQDAATFNQAAYASWRQVFLGSEHTWGYFNPEHPLAKKIEAAKAAYFEEAKATSEKLFETTLGAPDKTGSPIVVYNTLSWPRTGLVTVPAGAGIPKGLVTQKLGTGETVFLAQDVPALGSRTYQPDRPVQPLASDLGVTSATLENALVKVTLNPQTGDIASLIDKRSGHEFVDTKSPYSINSYRYLRGTNQADKATAPSEVRISIKENGPVLASLLVESKADGCNKLTREIRLLTGQPHVEFINTLDKVSTRSKEGVHFGFAFNVPDGAIRMDIPWGVMNPLTDQLPGSNKNWLAFQRWLDVSNTGHGITWTCIESPLIEIGDITANLLGGVHSLEKWRKQIEPTQTIFSWALNNHWHTNFPLEQGGVIPFHYAVLPHGAYDPAVVNRFGIERHRPLVVTSGSLPEVRPIVAVDNPRVFVSTIKPSEDGNSLVLRLRSVSDKPELVKLDWPAGKPTITRYCPADETPGEPCDPNRVELLPYGTASILIESVKPDSN